MDSIWSTECRKVLITEGKSVIFLLHEDGMGKLVGVHFFSIVGPSLCLLGKLQIL